MSLPVSGCVPNATRSRCAHGQFSYQSSQTPRCAASSPYQDRILLRPICESRRRASRVAKSADRRGNLRPKPMPSGAPTGFIWKRGPSDIDAINADVQGLALPIRHRPKIIAPMPAHIQADVKTSDLKECPSFSAVLTLTLLLARGGAGARLAPAPPNVQVPIAGAIPDALPHPNRNPGSGAVRRGGRRSTM